MNAKKLSSITSAALLSTVVLAACAPAASPTPAPTTVLAAAATVASPAPTATTVASTAETSWATLPAEIRCYFDEVAANDAAGVANCFTPEATIIDVSRRITGTDAIERWTANEVLGGRYEVREFDEQPSGLRVLLRFSPPPGTSEGWLAYYTFTLENGKLSQADLQYANP